MRAAPWGVKYAASVTSLVSDATRPIDQELVQPMTRLRTALLPAFLVISLVLAACGSDATSSSAGEAASTPSTAASETEAASASEQPSASETAETRVRIRNSAYDPTELTVPAGTEVTFLNADGFEHTVTEGTDGEAVDDPIVDEEIEQNGSVSVTFDESGTYNITCKIHSSMNMTITVEG
jgi:plastocyanin